jgi:hypothetical protein
MGSCCGLFRRINAGDEPKVKTFNLYSRAAIFICLIWLASASVSYSPFVVQNSVGTTTSFNRTWIDFKAGIGNPDDDYYWIDNGSMNC